MRPAKSLWPRAAAKGLAMRGRTIRSARHRCRHRHGGSTAFRISSADPAGRGRSRHSGGARWRPGDDNRRPAACRSRPTSSSSAEALRATTRLDDLLAALAVIARVAPGFLAVTNGPDGVWWLENGQPAPPGGLSDRGGGHARRRRTLFMAPLRWHWRKAAISIRRCALRLPAAALKCTRFGGFPAPRPAARWTLSW